MKFNGSLVVYVERIPDDPSKASSVGKTQKLGQLHPMLLACKSFHRRRDQ